MNLPFPPSVMDLASTGGHHTAEEERDHVNQWLYILLSKPVHLHKSKGGLWVINSAAKHTARIFPANRNISSH